MSLSLSDLELLLAFPRHPPNYLQNSLVADASVLTCGCLISEVFFLSTLTSNSADNTSICPLCGNDNAKLLAPVQPLRNLYDIIQQLNSLAGGKFRRRSNPKRRSSSNTDIASRQNSIHHTNSPPSGSMDLLSLFFKFAKEESDLPEFKDVSFPSNTQSIEIKSQLPSGSVSGSVSPHTNSMLYRPRNPLESSAIPLPQLNDQSPKSNRYSNTTVDTTSLAPIELDVLSEEREFNFSKCFPFYRKLSVFPTQQLKFNPFKGGAIRKTQRYISTNIVTYTDSTLGGWEVTRFVLILDKRWEVYEYIADSNETKPSLLCCGKLNGDYGKDLASLHPSSTRDEIVIKNDFSGNNAGSNNVYTDDDDIKKKLSLWELLHCKISRNFLVISGTKGIMRVFNLNSQYGELGKPIYTYLTNFPIRCVSVSPDDALIACSITARERVSGKEQPFIILHKINVSNEVHKRQHAILESVEPITITIPYRDPIKIINFNSLSTHIVCCTVWDSRYLIIRLRGENSDNYRRPRLIWTDVKFMRPKRKKSDGNVNFSDNEESDEEDGELMMDNEGITDLQFGLSHSNTIILTSCSLKNKPSVIIRLDGSLIDTRAKSLVSNDFNDAFSQVVSLNSSNFDKEKEEAPANITGSELIMKIPEIGSSIHKFAISPRRDGMVFLDKTGHLYLVSTPNFQMKPSGPIKKIVVLLGEVANAERFTEAASIKFSTDGGKVFVVDRKGNFFVFDFTKGVPGENVDVVKCKIINI